jgi:hypothetical protein
LRCPFRNADLIFLYDGYVFGPRDKVYVTIEHTIHMQQMLFDVEL